MWQGLFDNTDSHRENTHTVKSGILTGTEL